MCVVRVQVAVGAQLASTRNSRRATGPLRRPDVAHLCGWVCGARRGVDAERAGGGPITPGLNAPRGRPSDTAVPAVVGDVRGTQREVTPRGAFGGRLATATIGAHAPRPAALRIAWFTAIECGSEDHSAQCKPQKHRRVRWRRFYPTRGPRSVSPSRERAGSRELEPAAQAVVGFANPALGRRDRDGARQGDVGEIELLDSAQGPRNS